VKIATTTQYAKNASNIAQITSEFSLHTRIRSLNIDYICHIIIGSSYNK